MKEYDVIVIGTGASGMPAAYKCNGAGMKVAIVDSHPFGGTCAVRGCDPKKVLISFSELADYYDRLKDKGVSADNLKINWNAMMKFKRTITDTVPEDRDKGFKESGIDTYHGRARFISKDTIKIGDASLKAKYFMLGAGAKPMKLGISGEEYIKISDDFLELDELPKKVVFLGGGYISFEFANIAKRAGSNVTIIQRSSKVLKRFDKDIVKWVISSMNEAGIKILLNTNPLSVEKRDKSYIVHTSGEAGDLQIEADIVVHGAGREPDIEDMGLDIAGVNYDKRGIAVNEYLQSISNPFVYAGGDCAATKGYPLTPVAFLEGGIASYNIINGNKKKPDYAGMPNVVFTLPPMAFVGLTEEMALSEGFKFRVNLEETSGWYSSKRIGEKHSGFKVLIENDTERIIGAHLFGANAEEVINIFALAIRNNLTAAALKDAIYTYPSKTSDISDMCY
ncbi:MAG: NAD(P)/FAD-dependent oxidoreductase [Deltaproteobacteria bacterium]|nr:NAD(P)/FAD-dependent oxidoreductase [Deltaproteobacteria bacterium]